jgi:uncharacterized protein YkwD
MIRLIYVRLFDKEESMKVRPISLIVLLLALALAAAFPVDAVMAASTTLYRKPVLYKTVAGSDNGNPVSVLKVRDQSGSADDPSKYVLFSTPGTVYRGTQDFFLGGAYKPADVSGISLRVNFKGPARSTQAWTWKLFDWNASTWVKVGDNAGVQPGVWRMLVFASPASPKRFVNANGKIRVQVSSNNANQNARIDYEILRVTVTPSSGCTVQENSAFEAQVLSLVNAERAKKGVSPLARNDKLDVATQRHSNDMACNNFFDHTGSDGSSPWERMNQAGYDWIRAAENIAAGYSTPAAVVAGWMNSSGHKANILDPDLEDIGIAYAYKSNSDWGHYWTTDFGTQP